MQFREAQKTDQDQSPRTQAAEVLAVPGGHVPDAGAFQTFLRVGDRLFSIKKRIPWECSVHAVPQSKTKYTDKL